MWNTISKILNILLGLWVFYLYVENRRLKGFEIDKDIKLTELEIEKLTKDHQMNFQARLSASYSFDYSELPYKRLIKNGLEDNEYENKIKELKTKLQHLKRLKRYRWIFSK